MDDTQLAKLSVIELQELQAQLHVAIRAAIRAKQEAKASAGRPGGPATATGPATPSLDLARERDAWLARKRAGSVATSGD
ncbi:MAG: hypothetical protein SFW09_18135 [Hyphomicrobiaceae bacterium]|nr:hypothetical protein [Hyphomicrobiaceae bacterium]